MPHKNFKVLDQSVIDAMCARYRIGASVTDLATEFALGRNKIIKTLKEHLGPEYAACARLARASVGQKVAPKLRGRKNPHTPEWNAKIAAAHVGKTHSEETKALLAQRMKERELDPVWQQRKSEIANKIVEGKRARGVFELHAKKHGELMRAREREFGTMSKRAKQMWRDGKFAYGDGYVKRSKLEKRIFELVKASHPDAVHSYTLGDGDRTYCYDIFIPSLNSLIEVNGDFWHCNPKLMTDEEWLQIRPSLNEVRERDTRKARVAEERGLRLIVLWESDLVSPLGRASPSRP